MFLQRLANRARSIQRILDTKTVGDFVEHGVAKKRIKGNVLALVFSDQFIGNRHQDLVELGQHGVLDLQPACTLGQLHLFIIGQVDGDGFGTGITVTGAIRQVVGV